jgi:ATP synthase protein I
MDKEAKKLWRTLGYLSTIGLTMALSVGIGAVFGHWLDEKFGTGPWLFFIFLGFGIAAAFRNLHRMYRKLSQMDKEK